MNYREALPQMDGTIFLTDGGLETSLIFHEGFDLPYFAAFDLLKNKSGQQALKCYYDHYAALAVRAHTGFILESATWRANGDWAEKMGYSTEELKQANKLAIELLVEIRNAYALPSSPFVISGCIGPRGDGYTVGERMNIEQAKSYHSEQINTFYQTQADMITAATMTYPEEAIGITKSAQEAGLPVVISFTTETDGRLPCGTSLREAIEIVDHASNNGPAYYMINCAHPDHFRDALDNNEPWIQRIRGIRANASRMSHAELDEAVELDAGNPEELAQIYKSLVDQFPQFNVLGGCCGTDHRHIGQISQCCVH